jgi:hypothetical protein
MLDEVPPKNQHVLVAEGACCLDYPKGGDRVVLAIGWDVSGKPIRSEAVALRQEVVAALYAALLAGRSTRLRPGCPLYRLPCRWPHGAGLSIQSRPAADAEACEISAMLDRVWLLRPEGLFSFAVGDTPDDAVRLAGLVGVEQRGGQRHGFLWNGEYVERLWQTLLLGPGARFATPGGTLWEAFGLDEDPATAEDDPETEDAA